MLDVHVFMTDCLDKAETLAMDGGGVVVLMTVEVALAVIIVVFGYPR